MNNSKPGSIPIGPNAKLTKTTDDEQSIDQQLYQSVIGSLLYLSGGTRPDTVYSKTFEWENFCSFRGFSADCESFPLESLAVYST